MSLVRDPDTQVHIFAAGGDIGTPERARHGVRIHKRGVGVYGGGVIREGLVAEAEAERLLDQLDAQGWLGGDPAAGLPTDAQIAEMFPNDRRKQADLRHWAQIVQTKRELAHESRRKAAYWFSELFHKAGIAQSQVSSYSPLSTGGGEMSDHEAWNRACYNGVWKEIGSRNADLLQAVICFDQIPPDLTMTTLRAALDALAKWRGFI